MPVSHGYAIKEGSPVESGSPDGSEAIVTYVGPSANRYDFLKSIFGYVDTVGRVWVPRVEYPNPLSDAMLPVSYRMRPAFDGGQVVTLTGDTISSLNDTISTTCWTEVEITFSNRSQNGGNRGSSGSGSSPERPDGTYLDITRDGGVEAVTIPGRMLIYDNGTKEQPVLPANWLKNDPKEVDEDHILAVPYVERKITAKWKNVPYPDFDHIELMCGITNSEPWLDWPKFSVMLENYSTETSYDVLGTAVYSLTYQFSIRTFRIKTSTPLASNSYQVLFPEAVTRGMIGLHGRAYDPKEDKFKLVVGRKEDGNRGDLVIQTAPAADFNKLFEFQPGP